MKNKRVIVTDSVGFISSNLAGELAGPIATFPGKNLKALGARRRDIKHGFAKHEKGTSSMI